MYLRRRSRVSEVLAGGGVVLALAECGVCAAYSPQGQLLCFLNVEADECIRSLYIDAGSAALLTVSTFSSGALACCRAAATAPECLCMRCPGTMLTTRGRVPPRLASRRRCLAAAAGAVDAAGRGACGAAPGLAPAVWVGGAVLPWIRRV